MEGTHQVSVTAVRERASCQLRMALTQSLRRGDDMTNQLKISLMNMRVIEVDRTCSLLEACLDKYTRSSQPDPALQHESLDQ